MRIDLIGCGCGAGSLTAEASKALAAAELVLGAARLLPLAPEGAVRRPAQTKSEILDAIRDASCERICVLFGGDSGFYSGARLLLPALDEHDVRLLPGISSLQLFAARLGEPWQDWKLCSAHGVDCDAVAAVCSGRPAFFLTGGKNDPAALCRALTEAGLGFLSAAVGEALGLPDERIRRSTAEGFAGERFAPLSVLLVRPAPRSPSRTPGLPDAEFRRAEGIPMTKQEVRAAILSKLAVGPEDTCWDIGAGTGSVGIELALHAGRVYGVERDAAALALARENRARLGAWKLRLIEGEAPDALAALPAPDAVFVGGSGGRLDEILRAVHEANPKARICVSAITLEGLHNSISVLRELGYAGEVTQLAVTRGKQSGELTLMLAQNPVFLISGCAE